MRDKASRHPSADSDIGKMYASNANRAARYEVQVINSIFEHSEGYVMTRWNNNQAGFYITDIFGTPEDGKHILSKDHGCSDKSSFNIALAHRQRPGGANNGYCFKGGQGNTVSNCVCNDKHGSEQPFNGCSGAHSNWRRYNGKRSDKRFCRAMHGKCHRGITYGPLGDSYDCNAPGQRTIQGHFWQSHPGYLGMPCQCSYFNPGCYGCYGSRWIG